MYAGSPFAVGRVRRLASLALLAMLAVTAPAAADSQIFSLFDFQFEDGTVMPELRLAYDTQGTLSPGRDNAIVLLHDALGDRHEFDAMIGPGKLFDTDRYFIITADALGGGESSSPAEGSGQDFPRYTVRDMMAAEYALVSRGLGLAKLRAIVGLSMGAATGLEWAIQHPDMPRAVVLLAPSAKADANYQLIIDLMLSTVAFDPDWNGGRYERNPVEGLRHAGMLYYPWSVSTAYLDRITPAQIGQESDATAKHFAAWDANSLTLRFAACRGHDVATAFAGDETATLARATMPVLLLSSTSDRFIDPAAARHLRAKLPHASLLEIPSDLGHRGVAAPPGSQEGDLIDRTIRGFLK